MSVAMHIGRQIRTLKLGTVAPVRVPALGQNAVSCGRNMYDKQGALLPIDKQHHWMRDSRTSRNDARCVCTSACFLIWAAGVSRSGDWIGVHRPFFDPKEYANLTSREAEQVYARMNEGVKRYLVEMDIPDHISRKMMAANSESMHFLSYEEAQNLDNNQALEELAMARCGGGWKRWEKTTKDWYAGGRQCNAYCQKQAADIRRFMQAHGECMARVYIEAFRDNVASYLERYGSP